MDSFSKDMPEFCLWTETDDGLWESSCGQIHEFMEGGPKDNCQKYCGYCGKLLVEVLYEPEEVE